MSVMTYEGVVENGQVKLTGNVRLPEHAKVYIVVPEDGTRTVHFMSPKLVNPADAAQFKKKVTKLK